MIYLVTASILIILLVVELYNRNIVTRYTVKGYVNKSDKKNLYALPSTSDGYVNTDFILPESANRLQDRMSPSPSPYPQSPPPEPEPQTRQIKSMKELGIPRLKVT